MYYKLKKFSGRRRDESESYNGTDLKLLKEKIVTMEQITEQISKYDPTRTHEIYRSFETQTPSGFVTYEYCDVVETLYKLKSYAGRVADDDLDFVDEQIMTMAQIKNATALNVFGLPNDDFDNDGIMVVDGCSGFCTYKIEKFMA